MAAELILVDAETVRPLRGACGVEPGRTGDDDGRAAHFAAKKGKRVLGVVSVVPDIRGGPRERWRMVGPFVDERARGEGVGSMLVRAAVAIATNRGGGLWCSPDDAPAAFLGAHGFDLDGDALVARLDDAPPDAADDD